MLAVTDGSGAGTRGPEALEPGETQATPSLLYPPTAQPPAVTKHHPRFKSFPPPPGISLSFLPILMFLSEVPSRLILGGGLLVSEHCSPGIRLPPGGQCDHRAAVSDVSF